MARVPSESAAALAIAAVLSGEIKVENPALEIARVLKEQLPENLSEEEKAQIASHLAVQLAKEV